MYRTHPLPWAAVLLLASTLAAFTFAAPAFAGPRDIENYYSSFQPHRASAGGSAHQAARAQERYYASYGDPQPTGTQDARADGDASPLIALSIGGALALAAAGLAVGRGKHAYRRAQRTPA
jgi:hypothetical protein